MNVIKKFLVECGYEEEFLDSTDVKFDEPKLIDLVTKWQHQPSLRKFVEFAARYHLTPYSGNRECLLFKLEVSGSAVRNTLIGGFYGNKQEFELAGTRLNPEKVNPALSSFSNWQLATDHDLETYEDKKVTYKLKSFEPGAVWHFPEAYQAIYDSSVKVPAELKKKLTNEES
ncbi:hypothetical protein HWQ46_00675 [Shewanella sp. D64]|uniref:hypothetical protein n=1 Tax=unclassified Shewanella TaxID=196818 RepID=UPI0022BA3B72|nr:MULTISPECIES: hypothetical protein [unclassified Shewanella]MEC4724063.1 hypothetical protein [Shewanella sp. D64]MEC4736083.1 hypothetical protein [Shewanella sp. E94]WBJ97973.1 hypothetical protein HWQ47_13180 [Shewanella sp. MTB7]